MKDILKRIRQTRDWYQKFLKDISDKGQIQNVRSTLKSQQ